MKPEERADKLALRVLPASVYKRGQKWVYVKGRSGRTYAINTETSRGVNTRIYKWSCEIGRACFYVVEMKDWVICPGMDRVITEYLLIKNNEDLYLSTANVFETSLSVVLMELGVKGALIVTIVGLSLTLLKYI